MVNSLTNNTSIVSVLLGPNLGNKRLIAFNEVFSKNHTLLTISLIANQAEDEGVKELANGLKLN